jgi:predicted anti-sigma-YlaC factor YlaD
MKCEQVQEQRTAWLDGELTPEAAARIETHLAECAACRQAGEEARAFREMANAWEMEGGEVWEAVRRQIEADDLRAILETIQSLRAEMRALRAEVTDLRHQLAERPSALPPPPPVLLPYTPKPEARLRLA